MDTFNAFIYTILILLFYTLFNIEIYFKLANSKLSQFTEVHGSSIKKKEAVPTTGYEIIE